MNTSSPYNIPKISDILNFTLSNVTSISGITTLCSPKLDNEYLRGMVAD